MTATNLDDTSDRGLALMQLRQGVELTSQLAVALAGDALVGAEALGLLGRLRAIGSELESLTLSQPDPRRAHNDPFWNQEPHPFRLAGSAQPRM